MELPWLSFWFNKFLTAVYQLVRKNYRIWHFLARHYSKYLDHLAFFHANLLCDWAYYKVPAYRDLVFQKGIKLNFWRGNLRQYPETNKENYVKKYSFEERSKFGKFPLIGTSVDESSGSTGVAFNWIRSQEELRDVHTFSANYVRMVFPEDNIFTINAFSMGAWATGLNTTLSLIRIGMVKTIGPDIPKIIDTLKTFGPRYNYLICGYPPFLKKLIDTMEEARFPFKKYRFFAIVGGEGMTEALRDYLEKRFIKVRSGYGATDLQLGVGGESDMAVWLRREMMKNTQLKEKVLGADENRFPMVFQYNPLDHYVEINDQSEIVVTINNFSLLCPRLRYNIQDEGLVLKYFQFEKILRESGYSLEDLQKRFSHDFVRLPFLFVYGRKDGTVSYMGANIYPQDIEYGLYTDEKYSKMIEGFCLSLEEDSNKDVSLHLHIELKDGIHLVSQQMKQMKEILLKNIEMALMRMNKDFRESKREDGGRQNLSVDIHEFGQEVFSNKDPKRIKNKYLLSSSHGKE